jgi:hypothetical protein
MLNEAASRSRSAAHIGGESIGGIVAVRFLYGVTLRRKTDELGDYWRAQGHVAVQPVRMPRPVPQFVQCRGVETGCLLKLFARRQMNRIGRRTIKRSSPLRRMLDLRP